MHKWSAALRFIDSLNDIIGKGISFLMLFVVGIITWEVLLRYAFNSPTHWAHELTQFLFFFYCLLGAGYTLSRPIIPHVRVDIFYSRFSPKISALVDLLGSIFLFLFVGVLIWKGWEKALRSLVNMETSPTVWGPPVFPLKLSLVIGSFLLFIQGIVNFIRKLNILISGEKDP